MNIAKALLYGLAFGAGLMYLFDPDRGNRRRALIRDQVVHTWRKSGGLIDQKLRHFQNRVTGVAAETSAKLKGITDQPSNPAKQHPSDENQQVEPESTASFKPARRQRPGSTIEHGDSVDETSWESFPASDPPAWTSNR